MVDVSGIAALLWIHDHIRRGLVAWPIRLRHPLGLPSYGYMLILIWYSSMIASVYC